MIIYNPDIQQFILKGPYQNAGVHFLNTLFNTYCLMANKNFKEDLESKQILLRIIILKFLQSFSIQSVYAQVWKKSNIFLDHRQEKYDKFT